MLWQLDSDSAEQFFKSWNTSIKLIHDVPRSTYTYLVEGYFANGFVSLRNRALSRYSNFFHKLLTSPSREIRLLANIVSRDPHSVTAKNIKHIKELTDLSVWDFASWRIKETLPVKTVPECENGDLNLSQKV